MYTRSLAFSFFVLSICGHAGSAAAQDGRLDISHYIFDAFMKGTVKQKNGSISEQELNYNSLTSEMVFNNNGQYLAIADPESVDTVVIAGRTFVPGTKGFYELLVNGPTPLFEEYTCTVKEPGTSIGYGMSSNTTGSHSMKSLVKTGGAYQLKLPDEYQAVPGHSYWVRKDGKYLPANTAKQLNAAFPDKKSAISQYVKEKDPDLKKKDDITALVQRLQ